MVKKLFKKLPPKDNGKHPGGRPIEWTPERYEALAEELIEWAKQDDSMHMIGFTSGKYNRPKSWLYDLAEFSEPLKQALNHARELLAQRYTKKALEKEWDSYSANRWIGVYDKELTAYEKEKASWSKDKDSSEEFKESLVEVLSDIRGKKSK